jgi:GTP cyclohydrolase II
MTVSVSDDFGLVLARLAHGKLETDFGDFDIHVFHDGREEAVVLSLGNIRGCDEVLCRIHSECMCAHTFFSTECDCREQMETAQQWISENKKGLVIFLRQEGKGNGAAAHVATLPLKRKNLPQASSYRKVGFLEDGRSYLMAGKILNYFGIKSVTLITSNVHKIEGLTAFGVRVVPRYHLEQIIWLGRQREIFIDNIKHGESAPPLVRGDRQRVFIVGDLNVDVSIEDLINGHFERKKVAGTALNAAKAFQQEDFEPIIFGKIGKDVDGELITRELKSNNLRALLGITSGKQTGVAYLYSGDRGPDGPKNSANDYDLVNLDQALILSSLGPADIATIDAYVIDRLGIEHAASLLEKLDRTECFVVFDITPHLLYTKIEIEALKFALQGRVDLLIAEYRTFAGFLRGRIDADLFSPDSVNVIFKEFDVPLIVVRYGFENIGVQEVWKRSGDTYLRYEKTNDTGYSELPKNERSGFGDKLTARLFRRLLEDGLLTPKGTF